MKYPQRTHKYEDSIDAELDEIAEELPPEEKDLEDKPDAVHPEARRYE
jgi:hypothetical protein